MVNNLDELASSKLISTGAGASGGFGVPADYGGKPGKPDDVINVHNQHSAKFIQRLYDRYKDLPSSNPIRQQAEALLKQKDSIDDRTKQIREVTISFLEYLEKFEDNLYALSKLTIDTQEPVSELFGSIDETYDAFESDMQSQGIEIDRSTSPFSEFSAAIDHLSMVNPRSNGRELVSDPYYDECKASFDSALSMYRQMVKKDIWANQLEVDINNRLNDMQAQIHSEIIRLKGEDKTKNTSGRLLETLIDTPDTKAESLEGNVPETVPNYHLAIEASPRVCGNCRFFQGSEGVKGLCTIYEFQARSNYLCDAWQSRDVTPFHTPVRAQLEEGQVDMSQKSELQSPMIHMTPTYQETPGRVPGQHIVLTEVNEVLESTQEDINYTNDDLHEDVPEFSAPNQLLDGEYLPGDVVYSKSLNSLAVIDSKQHIEGQTVYGLKLMGHNSGTALSYFEDLSPRSKQATKADSLLDYDEEDAMAEDLDSAIEVTRDCYRSLKQVVDTHSDTVSQPMRIDTVLSPLKAQLKEVLAGNTFAGVKTGPKRKYWRAIQDAYASVSAARQVLFEGYKEVSFLKSSGASNENRMRVWQKAQQDSYERVVRAHDFVKSALTIASVTHGTEAPGVESTKVKSIKSDNDYIDQQVLKVLDGFVDNIIIDDDEYFYETDTRSNSEEEARKLLIEIAKIVKQEIPNSRLKKTFIESHGENHRGVQSWLSCVDFAIESN